ncbi:MAG: helix-turn-helix domain-containing protein [Desulfovibrio sp.]|nr:helix-turn-helix domain-containing protein [Desulfovibrio sp.]
MLRALEDGDQSNFPHVAYAKGFIRSYASFLGLAQEEIVAGLGLLGPLAQDNVAPRAEQARGTSFAPWLVQVSVLVLLLGFVLGGCYLAWSSGWFSSGYNWVVEKTKNFRKSDEESKKELTTSAPLSGGVGEREKAPEPSTPKEVSEATPSEVPTSPKEPPLERKEESPGAENPASPLVSDAHQVVIVALEPCWIHSTADGTDTRQFSLRKGDTFALSFKEKLDVKLGNAGGVRFRYNGQDIEPVGKSGQVKTVSFPAVEVQ